MQVIWKTNNTENSNILFKKHACWDEFCVKQYRVQAGSMSEQTNLVNEINLTIEGRILTKRYSSLGKKRMDWGTSDSMCIMPVGQSVEANWDYEYENLMIDFTPKYLSKMATEMNISSKIELKEYVSEKKDLLIQQLAFAFLSEAENNETSSRLYADSIAHTLMFHIIKNYTNAVEYGKQFLGGLSGYKLRRVTEFINDNLEKDLTLTEIAEVADLSHFHFARSFRKTLGVTPQQYITNRRIEKAKELLSKSNLPIVEIGFQTGFKNQSHFTTLFRKITSITPKIWREANQT